MKKSDVVNHTGGVQTEDGRTLYGLDAETHMRMKAKEDPEWERKLGEWIEDVLEHSIEDTCDLWKSLKSGVVLCALMNKLKPGIIKKYNDKVNLHVLQERENIELYLDACHRLGMDKSDLFVTSDLHSRRSMSAVLHSIHGLSKLATQFDTNSTGFARSVSLPVVPTKQTKKYKWELKYQNKPIYSEELGDDLASKLSELQKQLESSLLKIEKLEESNTALKTDLKLARERLRTQSKATSQKSEGQFWLVDIVRWAFDTIWQTAKNWLGSFGGVVCVLFFVLVWRIFIRTNNAGPSKTHSSKIKAGDSASGTTVVNLMKSAVSLLLE